MTQTLLFETAWEVANKGMLYLFVNFHSGRDLHSHQDKDPSDNRRIW